MRNRNTKVVYAISCLLVSAASTRDIAAREVFRNNSHTPLQTDQYSSLLGARGSARRCWWSRELHSRHPVRSRRPERLCSWGLSLPLLAHTVLFALPLHLVRPYRKTAAMPMSAARLSMLHLSQLLSTEMKVPVRLLRREVISLQDAP